MEMSNSNILKSVVKKTTKIHNNTHEYRQYPAATISLPFSKKVLVSPSTPIGAL